MIIKIENCIVEDTKDNIVEKEDGVTCGCKNPTLLLTSHADGTNFYTYQYVCKNCGNNITTKHKRIEKDMMMWECCYEKVD